MKRKSRNSKLMIDFIELRRDTTRLRKDAQYLMKTEACVQHGACSINTSKSAERWNSWLTWWLWRSSITWELVTRWCQTMCPAGWWTTRLQIYYHISPKVDEKHAWAYIRQSKNALLSARLSASCGTHYAVKAVEGGVEVGLSAQAIHFYKHLRQEYPQEDKFSKICGKAKKGRLQSGTRPSYRSNSFL